jgi:hypothetical protein
MADALRSDQAARSGQLPDELYIGFVDGLLVDAAPVFAAALAATSMEIVAAVAAKSTILLGASAAQPAIAAVRLFACTNMRHICQAPRSRLPADAR